MDLIIRDLRTILTNAGLNAIVPITDIVAGYTAESVGYPHISLGLKSGVAMTGLAGLSSVDLELVIYSDTSALEVFQIYDLVKGLLHQKEGALTSADRLYHAIYELSVDEPVFDPSNDIWKAESRYHILYSVSGVVATSGASGAIYAATSGVTAIAGNKIGDFSGGLTLDLGFQLMERTEQERFAKATYFNAGVASIRAGKVIFKEAILEKLYGITKNVSDTLADGATASTSRTFTQSIVPASLEFLFQMIRTDDGKKLEILATETFCPAILIPFMKTELTVYDCEFRCYGDSSDNVVKMNTQN